jgi:predicted MFS family arabinose efflux permease
MSMSSTNLSHHRHRATAGFHNEGGPVWLSAAAGLCASLVGLGLARFAYTPLIPALIAAKWFSPAEAVYLGAANLAGYLAGALIARELGKRAGAVHALRGTMALACLCAFACSVPVSFIWFFGWRFLAGLSGGVIMVLAASTILPHTAPSKRGFVGGVIFAGVGLGVAASGTLVPLLLQQGLKQSWYGLGVLSALLTLASWKAWPAEVSTTERAPNGHLPSHGRSLTLVRTLSAEYGLNALALVPHMVFLVDFVARGLGRGLHEAAQYWIVFGVGALAGPMVGGYLGDRIGFGRALRLAFLVQALCVALPLMTIAAPALLLSSFVVGAFVPGIVAVMIGRTHELLPGDPGRQAAAWGLCTTAFAIGQAVAGYGFSYIFAHSENGYPSLFLLAAGALLLALAVDLAFGKTPRHRL